MPRTRSSETISFSLMAAFEVHCPVRNDHGSPAALLSHVRTPCRHHLALAGREAGRRTVDQVVYRPSRSELTCPYLTLGIHLLHHRWVEGF